MLYSVARSSVYTTRPWLWHQTISTVFFFTLIILSFATVCRCVSMCWYFLSFFFCYLLFLVDVVFYLTHVTRRRWLFGRTVPYPWWTCTSTTRNRRRTSDRSTSASNTISKTRLSFWKSCRSVGHFLFLSFFFFCWKISILIFILQSSFSWFVSLFPFIFFFFL